MKTKESLRVASVQFEMKENDKAANIAKMVQFVKKAGKRSIDVVAFPEMCLSGYHYLTQLGKQQLLEIAESTKDGSTVSFFSQLATQYNIAILFGLLERGEGEAMYNTYVAITPEEGLVFQHRKVHAFENSAILQGQNLDTFDLYGWKCGILICYDNNIPENPRVMALNGAELIFAPHQTGGFDIKRAGMGRIPLRTWQNRKKTPKPMNDAIMGPKGRAWITKWLCSRAYDNNLFYVFSNGIGIDGPEVRTGNSMIIDPEGIIKKETWKADDDMVIATLSKKERVGSLPSCHMASRRPSLYAKITEPVHEVDTRLLRNKVSGEKIR